MKKLASFSNWSIANTGASGSVWRIYEGHTAPLLTSFMTGLTLTGAPDITGAYNGNSQSGASISAPNGVLGAAATGTNAGFYNGYYSTQQGYDISGGNLTINAEAPAPTPTPAQLSRVMTQLAANVFSPQTSVQPVALSIAPAITVTQTNSVEVAGSSTGIALQIVNGGMRLPVAMMNVNE